MMTDAEMTEVEVRQHVERADRFVEQVRDAITTAGAVDPASACADHHRRGLRRSPSTLDAVPYVTFCNLASLDAAMRGGLMQIIEVHLLAVGGGPALD